MSQDLLANYQALQPGCPAGDPAQFALHLLRRFTLGQLNQTAMISPAGF